MNIFSIQDGRVTVAPEALVIKPFAEIWERDTDSKKGRAMKDFGYVVFMTNPLPENPYSGYSADIREELVKRDVVGATYKPDDKVRAAMNTYEEFFTNGSFSYTFYKSSKEALFKLKDFLDSVDFTHTDKAGKPIYKFQEIMKALENISPMLNSVKKLEKQVKEEVYESVKVRANKGVNIFER